MPRRIDYAERLGQRIRAVRTQQGLPLGAVEEKSGGRFNGITVGSYERADRMITVERLSELAEFFGVPVQALTEEGGTAPPAYERPRIRFDLPALRNAPAPAGPLRRWIRTICEIRGDWNGKILTVRTSDLIHIAALLGTSHGDAMGLLAGWSVLAAPVNLEAVEIELKNAGPRR
ncbi:DNA-binding protein [Parafrankia soli]|uniref:DNA-binding protein n=2 Tax=Parafrankia soli TaxID=2599596 RepID=A0A1S1RKT3_9ACTN|nr:DNA-binding protein [Parafrankia soli]